MRELEDVPSNERVGGPWRLAAWSGPSEAHAGWLAAARVRPNVSAGKQAAYTVIALGGAKKKSQNDGLAEVVSNRLHSVVVGTEDEAVPETRLLVTTGDVVGEQLEALDAAIEAAGEEVFIQLIQVSGSVSNRLAMASRLAAVGGRGLLSCRDIGTYPRSRQPPGMRFRRTAPRRQTPRATNALIARHVL